MRVLIIRPPTIPIPLIDATEAWAAAGGSAANAGEGIKVAIIDTGIDIKHPCFSDAGYPTQSQLNPSPTTR